MPEDTRVTLVANDVYRAQFLDELARSDAHLTVEETVDPSEVDTEEFDETHCVITIADDTSIQEITEHIRENHPENRAVVVSSHAEREFIDHVLENDREEFVFLSEEGVSIGLISVRCKTLFDEM